MSTEFPAGGRWRSLRVLAEDRFGPVHLVAHSADRLARARFLSIEVLPLGLSRDRLLALLERLRGVQSPGLVCVVDLLVYPEGTWVLTDATGGTPLHVLLTARPVGLTGRAALHHILVDTLRGCLALHSVGSAHGAVGPHAVAVDPSGRVWLEDPGVAASVLGHPLTAAGDGVAWAAMARHAAQVWLAQGDRYLAAVEEAAGQAEAFRLRPALEALAMGAGAYAAGWQDRAALRGLVEE